MLIKTKQTPNDRLLWLKVVPRLLLAAGLQPLLVTLCKVPANSVSMKCSRTFMVTWWVKKLHTITWLVFTLLPLLLLNSLLILPSAQWKLSRSEFKLLTMLQLFVNASQKWRLKKVPAHSSRVWSHFGWDKSHTQWWSSLASKRPLLLFTNMLFQSHVNNAPRWVIFMSHTINT